MNTTNENTTGPATRARGRWPLALLALPAGVAIWSGWVELGQMAGFGIVHPLPGIADDFELNSAITLPIGVEAYSAYALGTWLSARPISPAARRFAGWSSLAALGLGLLGQVIYHLLSTAGYTKAPVAVVVFVACLPVLVLGAGAALHHLLADPPATPAVPAVPAPAETPAVEPVAATATVERPAPAARRAIAARPAGKRKGKRRAGRPLDEYLADARAQLEPGIEPTPAWCRKVTGCSSGTSVKIAAALRADRPPLTVAGSDRKGDAA